MLNRTLKLICKGSADQRILTANANEVMPDSRNLAGTTFNDQDLGLKSLLSTSFSA